MANEISLQDLRGRWNEVLDLIEQQDRIVWMAYFDARLESFDNGRLTLDFSDSRKLATGHDYQEARLRHRSLVQSAIYDIFKVSVVVVEK